MSSLKAQIIVVVATWRAIQGRLSGPALLEPAPLSQEMTSYNNEEKARQRTIQFFRVVDGATRGVLSQLVEAWKQEGREILGKAYL